MAEPTRYHIKTLKDMGQIPPSRVDAFLVDLRSCLLTAHGMTDLSESFVQGIDPSISCACMPESLTWVDDGANDLLGLTLEGGESMIREPIKHENIAQMVDGMHQVAKAMRDAGQN